MAIALAVLALAACGGNGDDGDLGDTGPATGPAPTGTVDDNSGENGDDDGY